MNQAQLFVQQTRAQAAMQLSQPAAAFTGGIGGAQPGIMSYAAGRVGAFAGGFGAGLQQSVGAAIGGMATVPAAMAALATPGARAFGDIIEGARYAGGGAPPMSLAGMLTTAYAPTSLFPFAGMAFGQEQGLRRQMAQEELGRRWTQGARGGIHGFAHTMTLGLSSYMMRRSGLEASWLGEMQTERTLQNRMGVLRGEGGYEAYSGRGVRRGFFQGGPGQAAMDVLQRRGGELQSQYGYSLGQMDVLTTAATGAIDTTRIQQYARGGRGGMRQLGQEISSIRETAGAMAREMQMSEKEIQEFFGRLKGVMQVTGAGVREFQQENRRLSMQGPFSQRQVAEMRMQFTQMGRQMYMGGAAFGTQAMEQANRVAELRRTGVISAETLLREGGGLDPQAMARMTAQRLQQQAGLVQGGAFNQALILGQANPQAYAGLLGGGAGFFQTQAAVGAAQIQNPFALLEARMNRNLVREVTVQAPMLAFRQAQQMGPLFWAQNAGQRRAQIVRQFGRNMGYAVNTAAGMGQAVTRYEEMEFQKADYTGRITEQLGEQGAWTLSGAKINARQQGRLADDMMALAASGGVTSEEAFITMDALRIRQGGFTEYFATNNPRERQRILQEELVTTRAARLLEDLPVSSEIRTGRLAAEGDPNKMFLSLKRFAAAAVRRGVDSDMIAHATFGERADFQVNTERSNFSGGWMEKERIRLSMERVIHAGDDKFSIERREMRLSGSALNDVYKKYKVKMNKERLSKADQESALRQYALRQEAGGKTPWETTVTEMKSKPKRNAVFEALLFVGGGWAFEPIINYFRPPAPEVGPEGLMPGAGGYKGVTQEEAERTVRADKMWREEMALGSAGNILDLLGAPGVAARQSFGSMAETIAEFDVNKSTQNLMNERQFAPIINLALQADKANFAGLKLSTLRGTMSLGDMRRYFKEYAVTEKGHEVMTTAGFAEFGDVAREGVKGYQAVYAGMGQAEQKRFFGYAGKEALEKSQRLLQESRLGDSDINAMHVKIDLDQLELLKK